MTLKSQQKLQKTTKKVLTKNIVNDKDKKEDNSATNHSDNPTQTIISSKFKQGIYKTVQYRSQRILFAKLYTIDSLRYRYIVAIVMGVLFGIVTLFFAKNTGLYSSGLSGFLQGISRFLSFSLRNWLNVDKTTASVIYNVTFWVLFLVFNVPLLFFSWFKLSRTFTKLSFSFLLATTLSGLLINLIPGSSDIYLFGNPTISINTNLSSQIDAETQLGLDSFNTLKDDGIVILPFSTPTSSTDTQLTNFFLAYDTSNNNKPFFLFCYGFAYGIATGFIFGITFIIGSCTGGTDFISVFFATKRQINISTAMLMINIISMLFGTIFGTYLPAVFVNHYFSYYQFFFSSNAIFTIFQMIIFTFIYNRIFVKGKLIRLEIFSQKSELIKSKLYNASYQHGITKYNVSGMYTNSNYSSLVTVCSEMELPNLLLFIKNIDDGAIICSTPVSSYYGKFCIQNQRSK